MDAPLIAVEQNRVFIRLAGLGGKGTFSRMVSHDPKEYITALALKAPVAAINRATYRDGEALPVHEIRVADVTKDQTFLADKSAISFVSGVSGQNRLDVLQSTLLAQLAANKKFPDATGSLDWCTSFADVLANIGWVVEGAGVSSYQMKGDLFQMDTAIIEVLVAAFGQDYLSIIKSTLGSMGKLAKDGRVQVFEKNTHNLSKGFFQMGLVSESNNAVSLQLGAFFLSTSDKIENILFFHSSKESSSMEYFSRKASLTPEIYATIRPTIVAKLGAAVTKYVDEIEI